MWGERLRKEVEETQYLEMVRMSLYWKLLKNRAKIRLNYLPQKCLVLREDFADHQRYQVRLVCMTGVIYDVIWCHVALQLELGDRGEVLGAKRTKAKELPSRLVCLQLSFHPIYLGAKTFSRVTTGSRQWRHSVKFEVWKSNSCLLIWERIWKLRKVLSSSRSVIQASCNTEKVPNYGGGKEAEERDFWAESQNIYHHKGGAFLQNWRKLYMDQMRMWRQEPQFDFSPLQVPHF